MIDYPRRGQKIKMREPKGQCRNCSSKKAEYTIGIEVDCFRGNDEVHKLCSDCSKLPMRKMKIFLNKKEVNK